MPLLIVSDIDGTLVHTRGASLLPLRNLLAQVPADMMFTLCSGRHPRYVMPIVHELGLTQGIAGCLDGAACMEWAGDVFTLRDDSIHGLSKDSARAVCNALRERNLPAGLMTDAGIVLTPTQRCDGSFLQKVCRLVEPGARVVTPLEFEESLSAAKYVFQIRTQVTPDAVEPMKAFTQSLGAPIVAEHFPEPPGLDRIVTFRHAQADKGEALDYLRRNVNGSALTWDNVTVFGDWYNDIPMLAQGALSIVPYTAPDVVKAAAKKISNHPTGDGMVFREIELLLKTRCDEYP